METWYENFFNAIGNGAVSMFAGRRSGKSTMATATLPHAWAGHTLTGVTVDEASDLTQDHLNQAYNQLVSSDLTDSMQYSIVAGSDQMLRVQAGGGMEWVSCDIAPEPEPEPVFDNLGDFLLYKYNNVKEVKVCTT